MYEFPFTYEEKNLYNGGIHPSIVHCRDTSLQSYFRKYLLQKAMSVYKWKFPENWDADYFLFGLYCYGYMAVLDTEDFGVIPQWGALGGYNVFYRPTYIIVTNPLLPATKRTIDIDCTIIKFQPNYASIMDIVNYYADQMALCSQAVSINLLNTHAAVVFPAAGKSMAESLKKMFDKVASGEPAVFADKSLFDDTGKPLWTPFQANVKELYVADTILADMRKIEARFDTVLGIPNANTDKRERLITDEVNANNVETQNRAEMWLEELQRGIAKAREMFGITDLSVEWRIDPMKTYEGEALPDGIIDSNGVDGMGTKSI